MAVSALPPEHDSPAPYARARRLVWKALVSAFVIWHVMSVTWWNIPINGFPTDVRTAALPQPLLDAENEVMAWKRWISGYSHERPSNQTIVWLEQYTARTATWQNWWMFAPNPLSFHRYIAVFAVVGKKPNGDPIYDPEPIWSSYRGSLEEELTRFESWGNFFAPYTHDHKLVENLTLGEFDPQLGQFAHFWADEYWRRKGRKPIGTDIRCWEYPLPHAFTGERAKDVPGKREWVIWWFRY